jgi:hypothetical protein
MTIVRRKIASEINVKSGSARGLYASRGFAVAEGKKRPIIWNAAKGTLIRGVTPDVFGKDRHGRFHRPDRVRCYGRSRFRARPGGRKRACCAPRCQAHAHRGDAIAEKEIPGGKVVDADVDTKNGAVSYAIDIDRDDVQTVLVDLQTGSVVKPAAASQDDDDDDDDDRQRRVDDDDDDDDDEEDRRRRDDDNRDDD